MSYRKILFFTILMAMLAGLSCWGKASVREFYLIEYLPDRVQQENSGRPYSVRVQLETFRVLRVYNRQQILFRYSPNRMQYYTYKTWAVRPEDMITDMAEKHLLNSNLFVELHREFLDARPDYRLEGIVEALEKYDAQDLWFAHLAMTLRLIREEDKTEIWQHTFDERREVYNPEMVYTVQAMSDILETQMNLVVEELDRLFLRQTGSEADFEDIVPKPPDTEMPSLQDIDAYELVPGKRALPSPVDTLHTPSPQGP